MSVASQPGGNSAARFIADWIILFRGSFCSRDGVRSRSNEQNGSRRVVYHASFSTEISACSRISEGSGGGSMKIPGVGREKENRRGREGERERERQTWVSSILYVCVSRVLCVSSIVCVFVESVLFGSARYRWSSGWVQSECSSRSSRGKERGRKRGRALSGACRFRKASACECPRDASRGAVATSDRDSAASSASTHSAEWVPATD